MKQEAIKSGARHGYEGSGEAEDVLRWAIARFHPRIGVACSFQYTVLVDMVLKIRPDVTLFSIDTGRLPEETYACAHAVERKYGVRIHWYHPRHTELEALDGGVYGFRESIDARRHCCLVRKVEPLNRALTGLDAWITGIRRDQGAHRGGVGKVAVDGVHGGILKIAPLADWTEDQLRAYAHDHDLPRNRLLDQGYRSVGCACCTRPVGPGEETRAGRWWWEESEHKECGLHVKNWQI